MEQLGGNCRPKCGGSFLLYWFLLYCGVWSAKHRMGYNGGHQQVEVVAAAAVAAASSSVCKTSKLQKNQKKQALGTSKDRPYGSIFLDLFGNCI